MAYTDELCAPYERKRLETGVVQHMSTNTGRGTDASSDVFLNNHLITSGYITFGDNTLLSTTHITFAHEVGHNLGAQHDRGRYQDGCDPRVSAWCSILIRACIEGYSKVRKDFTLTEKAFSWLKASASVLTPSCRE